MKTKKGTDSENEEKGLIFLLDCNASEMMKEDCIDVVNEILRQLVPKAQKRKIFVKSVDLTQK